MAFFIQFLSKGREFITDYQRKQIRELRLRGVGYRAIASAVGVSRDVVRNYCKSNGLEGYGNVLTMNINEQIQKDKACLYCGKQIVQPSTGRRKKFCSDKCRREWWKSHPELIKKQENSVYTQKCTYCGKEFKSYGNKNRKYCSQECYVHDSFWREEEGREPYVDSNKEQEPNT